MKNSKNVSVDVKKNLTWVYREKLLQKDRLSLSDISNILELSGETFDEFVQAVLNYSKLDLTDNDLVNTTFENNKETWVEIAFAVSAMYNQTDKTDDERIKSLLTIIKNGSFDEIKKARAEILEIGKKWTGVYSITLTPFISEYLNYSVNTSQQDKDANNNFVYVAKQTNEIDLYKIGKTKDIAQRESTFKTGNCFVRMIMSLRTEYATQIESFLHDYFANKNYEREWFKLTASDLQDLQSIGFVQFLDKE